MLYYRYFAFFYLIFFSGCVHNSISLQQLTKQDQQEIEHFLNLILFEHQGAFVLFGSKPLSEVMIYPPQEEQKLTQLIASLPESLREQAKIIEYPFDPYKCWNTWKRSKVCPKMQKFKLVERPLRDNSPGCSILLINTEAVLAILEQHKEYFSQFTHQAFNPKKELHTISNPSSVFWKKAFNDHLAQGLLFGYGERNAGKFSAMINQGDSFEDFGFSTNEDIEFFHAQIHQFSIPKFRSLRNDPIINLYQQQKQVIEKNYQNKSVLEVTIRKLAEKM